MYWMLFPKEPTLYWSTSTNNLKWWVWRLRSITPLNNFNSLNQFVSFKHSHSTRLPFLEGPYYYYILPSSSHIDKNGTKALSEYLKFKITNKINYYN